MAFMSLLDNVALLLAVSLLHGLWRGRTHSSHLRSQLVSGALFAFAVWVAMSRPWEVVPGVVFDGRAIVISVAGMFGGPLPVAIAGVVAIVYRLYIGGIGALAGIVMIVSSGILGLGGYYGRKRWSFLNRIGGLYCFGLLVHVNVLLWTVFLPHDAMVTLFKSITVPVLVIYPIANLLLGILLVNLEQKAAADWDLRVSRDRLRRMVDKWDEQRLIQCRMIVEHFPHRVFVKDLDSAYIACNQTYARDLGLDPTQIIGKTDFELFPRELAEQYRADDVSICQSGQPRVLEETYVVGGVTYWVRTSKVPMYDEEGGLVSLLGVFEDITDRVVAEQALREREELLSEMSRIAHIGAWEFNPETLEGTWTDEVARIYDMNPEDPTSATIGLTGFQGESRQRIEQAIERAVKQAEPYDLVLELITQKGTHKWVRAIGYPVVEEEQVIKLQGTFQDITAHKQAQDEIHRLNEELEERVQQRTAQLDEANKDLEAFAYSVSHDLRAPLRAISGFAQIIARRYREDLNDEGRHYFDNIVQASDQMGQLIDDLLQVSRLGRKAVCREAVDLSRIFGDLQTKFEQHAAEKQATLSLPQQGPSVLADPTLVNVILTNLVENALMYRRESGEHQVKVEYRIESERVILSVADNGIGIAPEYQDKVFEMFQRLHSQSEYPGTGIGLAMCRKASQLLGTSIRLESEEGKGSVFFLELPLLMT